MMKANIYREYLLCASPRVFYKYFLIESSQYRHEVDIIIIIIPNFR